MLPFYLISIPIVLFNENEWNLYKISFQKKIVSFIQKIINNYKESYYL